MQSNTCGASLPVGSSCTITFTANTQEGPTAVSLAGTNTNSINLDITSTAQPIISVSDPTQPNRIVSLTSMSPLDLVITNSAGSLVNANDITVTDKTACPDLLVDNSDSISVAPAGSCNLRLTSNTPYVPCTITVQGSNTAAPALSVIIAFEYLGGLVFEKTGLTGRVVNMASAPFLTSRWTNTDTDISTAISLTDGENNTTEITNDMACSGSPSNCAAQLCRNIGPTWYLPARDELISVFSVLCANGALPCNFGGFQTSHWSSTQVNPAAAFVVFPPNGFSTGIGKSSTPRVRCIREF